VDDGPLGKRRVEVADRRAGLVDPAVEPGVEDRRAGLEVVVVVLEPVNHHVFQRREAPDLTDPGLLSDLVHSPVVRRAQIQLARRGAGLIDRIDQQQLLRAGAKVDLVRGGLATSTPAQDRVRIDTRCGIGRLRLAGLHGDVEEADLTQAILSEHPPVAVDGQPDGPGCHALEVHDAVMGVAGLCAGPGQLGVTERGPVGSIGGVFDRHVLEPEPEHRLELDVVVPDPHLVELVDLVELVLDVDGIVPGRQAQPHVRGVGGMPIRSIKAGTVDGPFRAHACVGNRVARRDDAGDRIGERFGREAPDFALEDSTIRRGVDLVDSPVVGRSEFEKTIRIVAGIALALTDQDAQRVGPAGGVDIIEDGPEVDVVGHRRLARRPLQHDLAHHIRRGIGRHGVGRRLARRRRQDRSAKHVPRMAFGAAADRDDTRLDFEGKDGEVLVYAPVGALVDADVFAYVDETHVGQPGHAGNDRIDTQATGGAAHAVVHEHVDDSALCQRDVHLVGRHVLIVVGQHDVLGADDELRHVGIDVGPVHKGQRALVQRIRRDLRVLGGVGVGVPVRHSRDQLGLGSRSGHRQGGQQQNQNHQSLEHDNPPSESITGTAQASSADALQICRAGMPPERSRNRAVNAPPAPCIGRYTSTQVLRPVYVELGGPQSTGPTLNLPQPPTLLYHILACHATESVRTWPAFGVLWLSRRGGDRCRLRNASGGLAVQNTRLVEP